MIFSSFKHSILVLFFFFPLLFPISTTPLLAMDPPTPKKLPQEQTGISLELGLERFRQQKWKGSMEIFEKLMVEGSATVPSAFVRYMKEKELASVSPELLNCLERMPLFCKEFSQGFLDISLEYINFMNSTTLKAKNESLAKLQKLRIIKDTESFTPGGPPVILRELHGYGDELLRQIYDDNPATRGGKKNPYATSIEATYKNENTMKKNGKMRLTLDLHTCLTQKSRERVYKGAPTSLTLKTFDVNFRKRPLPGFVADLAMQIYNLKQDTNFPPRGYWSMLASENGLNTAVLHVAKFFLEAKRFAPVNYYLFQAKTISKKDETYNELHKQILTDYQKIADQGDKEAQYNYALMLYKGEGGEIDLRQARDYFKKAAERGHEAAYGYYALMLQEGEGGVQDLCQAREYFRISAEHGATAAQCAYAMMLYKGKGGAKDLKNAREYYKEAADKGNAYAQNEYAIMLHKGEGGEKNIAQASKYYRKSIKQGYEDAPLNYSTLLFEKENVSKKDFEKAAKTFKMDADKGRLGSQFNYAQCLEKMGDAKSLKLARQNYKEAADKGFKEAQLHYALMLQEGEGGEQDLLNAREYFSRSAEQGLKEAQYIYAMMLQKGEGGEQDLLNAREYFRKSADQGLIAAQFYYAIMLGQGDVGEKDLPKSREYFRKSAEQGLKEAQYNYAMMLHKGEGGEQDLLNALEYFRKSAEQGLKEAQYNYAMMLQKGEGGEQNSNEALDYFLKSLNQGFVHAIILRDSMLKVQNAQQEELELEKDTISLTLPPLEQNKDSSDEDEEDSSNDDQVEDPSQKPQKLGKEIAQLTEQNAQRWKGDREKKRKAFENCAEQVFETTQKSYDAIFMKRNLSIKLQKQTEKSHVKNETLELVNSIFGVKGAQKIRAFTNTQAQQAFGDIGCMVMNKEGENSTLLSFNLGEDTMKLKYHNPHGHGDDKLYNALRPHFKRYLSSIDKTPEDLSIG
ncbi:MAG: sel1 repeat family protein [Alphaproteobacteria bacterium]|nr:sel1 repeat family protein [Alphaproteobacteria bacterium]